MRRNCRLLFLAMVLISLQIQAVMAEDTLATVMARMKPETAVRIHYDETRFLELMAEPWQGSGYMYAMPPDIMVKEQIQPVRELAGASDRTMYYFDPSNNIHFQRAIIEDDPISLNVLVFKALINGDQDLLEKMYRIDFFSGLKIWRLTLTPKSEVAKETLAKVIISGLPEQVADKIVVYQVDGDYSEFVLKKDAAGEQVEALVSRLFQQLKAN